MKSTSLHHLFHQALACLKDDKSLLIVSFFRSSLSTLCLHSQHGRLLYNTLRKCVRLPTTVMSKSVKIAAGRGRRRLGPQPQQHKYKAEKREHALSCSTLLPAASARQLHHLCRARAGQHEGQEPWRKGLDSLPWRARKSCS